MIEWYKKAMFKDFANFKGRSRRSEFWYFYLTYLITLAIAMVLDSVLGLAISPLPYGIFYLLVALASLIPTLSVSVRRLHDVGKSGWFYFIILIPIIGFVWLLVLYCTDGEIQDNNWGKNPKSEKDEIEEIGAFQE